MGAAPLSSRGAQQVSLKEKLHPFIPTRWMKYVKALHFALMLWWDVPRFCWQLFWHRSKASTLLCISSPASVGGTELQVNKIAEQLRERGESPLVILLGPVWGRKKHFFLQRLKERGIATLSMGYLGQVNPSLLKRFQATTCYLFNPACAPLIRGAKEAGLKVIYVETGLPSDHSWWKPLFPHVNALDGVIGICQASLDHFRTLFHYAGPGKVFYPLIDPLPAQRTQIEKPLHIVYFGGFHRNKGVHHLLEAFQVHLKNHPQSQLTLIGRGLEQKAPRVRFLDRQTREGLAEQLAMCNVFCLPSLMEGAPCSILEAMSMGLPVVATCVGGIPELMEDGVSGILVPPQDSQALANAFNRLAEDPFFREKMGQNGSKRYRALFSSASFPF